MMTHTQPKKQGNKTAEGLNKIKEKGGGDRQYRGGESS